jgi:transposase
MLKKASVAAPPSKQSSQAGRTVLLNGLGFVSAPLYLFERFFIGTPTEHLLGEGVKPEHLKEQQVVERGFRFLRDPLFLTSSVFLKSEKRIMALAMVMALCLLVYSLGQRLIRRNLAREQASVPDQKGKPTSRPTLRWVFQMFMSVHFVTFAGQQFITNLTEERKHLLRFFSPTCRKYYLLQ